MTNRATLSLVAAFALSACAAPESMVDIGAPEPVSEAPMVLTEPAPARDKALAEECSGDGIGGTGCPDL